MTFAPAVGKYSGNHSTVLPIVSEEIHDKICNPRFKIKTTVGWKLTLGNAKCLKNMNQTDVVNLGLHQLNVGVLDFEN